MQQQDDVKRQQHVTPKHADTQVSNNFAELGGKDLLDAGLQAAKRGWQIFPCNAKKRPLVDNWDEVATTDLTTITAWSKQWPGAQWAYAIPNDVLVFDLDRKHGLNGLVEFERLQGYPVEKYDAPKVVTGTAGNHVYTKANGHNFTNSRSTIAPGIDTRTGGGYCIIPSGNGVYRWLTNPDGPLPDAPPWAEAALRRETNYGPWAEAAEYGGYSPYGNAILVNACAAIADAPNGKQEEILTFKSYDVGHYVGGGLLEYVDTIEALVTAGLKMVNYDKSDPWKEHGKWQIRDKVTNRVNAGMKEPLDGEEPFRAMKAAHQHLDENPQLQAEVLEYIAEVNAQKQQEEPKPEEVHETEEEAKRDKQGGKQQERPEPDPKPGPKQEPKPPKPSLVRRMGKGLPPPVEFLVEGLFHKVGTGIISSKYLGGKTFVAMALAASAATGKPFAGCTVNRRGAVLWLAAEGEREVDKRIRAAVIVLECDPDEQPVYVQRAGVPKLLSTGGEASIMEIVMEAQQMAMDEFGLPLVLIVIDTMIKSAGYKKSENDSVDVSRTIEVMDNIAIRTKCFVLALDHMGWKEEHVRGSSDKPSSVDVYIELKSNGGDVRIFKAEKVKGEKGNEEIDFRIVGKRLDDGQKTAVVDWGRWKRPEGDRSKSLNGNAKMLWDIVCGVINSSGQQRTFFEFDGEKRSVQKKEIYSEFRRKYKKDRPDMAFKRSWQELIDAGLVTTVADKNSSADMDAWVHLEA
jgi:AAA domain/Bifunctional DNA primase/polymerase, N-terminal